jgi:hypothetical protein
MRLIFDTMQLTFGSNVNKLTKLHKKYIRYKDTCVDNYPNCDKLIDNKTLEDFASCQVRCQYSYEYQLN